MKYKIKTCPIFTDKASQENKNKLNIAKFTTICRGDRTRTYNFKVMSLARYQLRHSTIFIYK